MLGISQALPPACRPHDVATTTKKLDRERNGVQCSSMLTDASPWHVGGNEEMVRFGNLLDFSKGSCLEVNFNEFSNVRKPNLR